MFHMKRISGICGISILILSFFITSIPEPVNATQALVEVHLDHEMSSANVEPCRLIPATISGVVTCDMVGFGSTVSQVDVFLQAETQSWPALISPAQMKFDISNNEMPFTVVVKVPQETHCSERQTVTITGQWSAYPTGQTGEVPPEDAMILVDQYYSFDLKMDSSFVKASPGQEKELVATLHNRGNGENTFSIEVRNLDDLNNDDVMVTLSQSTMTLESDQEREFEIRVNLPSDIGPGVVSVVISAVSQGETGEIPGEKVIDVHLRVDMLDSIAFNPITYLIIAIIIAVVAFSVFMRKKRKRKKIK